MWHCARNGRQVESHSMRQQNNDMPLDPVRRQLLRLLAENRSNLRTASLALGRNESYLHQFIHRGTPRVLAEDDREILAEHLGCSPDELRHDRSVRLEARRKPPPSAGPHSAPKGHSVVPEIEVRAAAGTAAWNDGLEEIRETWLFADPLIRHEFGARPDDLRMIKVDGVSMEPLLSSGDRILIDLSRTVPVPPGIFVIWDGMGLVAKHVEHLPHSEPPTVVLKSLNPEYKSYERSVDEVHIVGKAIWVSRKL